MKLAIERAGSGPNLVLLHGWGMDSRVWSALVPSLSAYFCVHLVDLPGYGSNQHRCVEDYRLTNLAQMLGDVLPKERIILMGWSMGGLIATRFQTLFPARVEKLVLVASSPCFTVRERWPGIQLTLLERFGLQLQDDYQRTIEQFIALQALGSDHAREDIKQLKHQLKDCLMPHPKALIAGLDLLAHCDLRQELSECASPVLVLLGSRDSLVPKQIARPLGQLLQDGEIIQLMKASHAPFVSHRQEFAEKLINWLIK